MSFVFIVSACSWLVVPKDPPDLCNDGVLQYWEQCEGSDLRDKTCVSFGFAGGELGCTSDCRLTTEQCTSTECGNGIREESEQCDGGDLGENSCLSLDYDGGELSCSSTCEFDTSGCFRDSVCGDGFLDVNEECDGQQLAGESCESFGFFQGGNLACSEDCRFDFLNCFSESFTSVNQLTGGERHTCAIAEAAFGKLFCWGSNEHGQLGLGIQRTFQPVPRQVMQDKNFFMVSAGRHHTCAITRKGFNQPDELYCWGKNGYGQLGDGTTLDRFEPVLVANVEDPILVSAGDDHTCAVTRYKENDIDQGKIFCWGRNDFGQLGDGSTDSSPWPVQVADLDHQLPLNITAGRAHSCAVVLRNISTPLFCWGDNRAGQLGLYPGSHPGDFQTKPMEVNLNNVHELSAGDSHTCATWDPGHMGSPQPHVVLCWGDNTFGQLGLGPGSPMEPEPIQIAGLENVLELSAGGFSTCVILRQNQDQRWCWGHNHLGQLGLGHEENMDTPTLAVWAMQYLNTVFVGPRHGCVATNNLTGCWGDNSSGQLGTPGRESSSEPVTVER